MGLQESPKLWGVQEILSCGICWSCPSSAAQSAQTHPWPCLVPEAPVPCEGEGEAKQSLGAVSACFTLLTSQGCHFPLTPPSPALLPIPGFGDSLGFLLTHFWDVLMLSPRCDGVSVLRVPRVVGVPGEVWGVQRAHLGRCWGWGFSLGIAAVQCDTSQALPHILP